ncbi:MAG: nicotinate (nicotinamide) nucleotide adenylyltransferase [Campylobacteraceae bacterium]|nr:nicotinate (nicotinamide) nucleotide adenylyltransferase [Campylobacteraceae bacterium]
MNIALFGGSFDPPHIGHDEIVNLALKNLDIDKLVIMPTYLNPFKESFFLEPSSRLNLCKKLWGCLDKVEISDYEISQTRPVATVESVEYLYSKFDIDKFYLIIGADNLKDLDKWSKFNQLKNLVSFVVATRNNINIPKHLQKLNLNVNISSTIFRESLSLELIPAQIKDEIKTILREKFMEKKLEVIRGVLETKKAEEIEIIDVQNDSYIAKFVVIATALTGKHGLSLTDDLEEALKPLNENFLGVEASDEWSVIDLGDVVIHLMSEECRAKYNIEELLEKLNQMKK